MSCIDELIEFLDYNIGAKMKETQRARIGRYLSSRRYDKGFTQIELAKAADISQSNISQIELWKTDIKLCEVFKLSKALKIDSNEFMTALSNEFWGVE